MARFKSRFSDEDRHKAVERVRAGEPIAKVATELNAQPAMLRKWKREEDGPRGVAPPDAIAAGKVKGTPGRKTVTEATAGTLLSGAFTCAGIFDGCDVWVLNPTERDSLAVPLSDSLRVLPPPIAEAVQTYSAPATFASALVAVIAHKLRLRAERKKAERERARPGMFVPPPAQHPHGSSNASANGFTVAAAATVSNGAPHPSDLAQAAAAAAAAHGSLAELDIPDDGDATHLLS